MYICIYIYVYFVAFLPLLSFSELLHQKFFAENWRKRRISMAFLLVNPFRALLVAVADNRRLLLDVILVVVDAWARFAHGTPTCPSPLVPRTTPSGNDDISSNFVAAWRVHSHRNAVPGSVLWRCLWKCIENIWWQFEKMKIFTSGPRTERESAGDKETNRGSEIVEMLLRFACLPQNWNCDQTLSPSFLLISFTY